MALLLALHDEALDHLGFRELAVEAEVVHRPGHHRLLIVLIVDGEGAGQPLGLAVLPQDADPDAVEGAHPQVVRARADELHAALLHLPRRAVGEGDGQDLPGREAHAVDEPGDLVGDRAGLAAAGASQHQHRPVVRQDGLALRWVQAGKDGVGVGVGVSGGRRRAQNGLRAEQTSGIDGSRSA